MKNVVKMMKKGEIRVFRDTELIPRKHRIETDDKIILDYIKNP